MNAREKLRRLDARIEQLRAMRPKIAFAAADETAKAHERARVVDWEKERVILGDVHAMATMPQATPAPGISKWQIGAGHAGKLLAVWEVTSYRSDRFMSLIHGSAPDEVVMAVQREWRTKRR